ncbi:MAG: tRNA lysidine(34) synthetase TilS [Candidatus Omnitrophica bacterium]|nr:tRNA lysidine(34) synthetase TilS [Candidatus Omnitrophota bacterium]MDD5690636.1 tRNA lysidine(34) synthetase TilS [Candidatus Omnitrophota bacterium]
MKEINATIKKYRLIQNGDKILMGVSGGPDSLTLLLQLFSLKNKLGLTLHVAHIDHGLRKDSGSDAFFVEGWAGKLGIPITSTRLNPEFIKRKGSLEEACRQARMDFFIRTAKEIRADKIALGHNLDDQAETILMRLLRGTGLSGLTGISVKRRIKKMVFIRPLLETSRKEIEGFLKRRGVKPRIDSTNKEDVFFRNKIRHNLIPLLKKEYNKNITEVLANLAESISYDYEYLDQIARNKVKGNNLLLNIKRIRRLHPAILRLKIRQSIACIQGDTRRIGFQHIKELEDMLNNRPIGSIVDLPKGISVKKTRNALRFYRR